MHMRGEPRTMQHDARYDDVVGEVRDFLRARAEKAVAAGVDEVWIDPGIGFGKTTDHNLSLLRHLDVLVATGFPVMVGASRKSFVGRLTGDAPVDDRREGSLATAVWCMLGGVRMVRVHDVDTAIREAVRAEHGFFHTAVMHSTNIDHLHNMARAVNTSLFVKNAPSYAGLGVGGEGYTAWTIAGSSGDGLTTARTYTRERRCTLKDRLRIV